MLCGLDDIPGLKSRIKSTDKSSNFNNNFSLDNCSISDLEGN
jgi:hypothetical protein